MSEPPHPPLMLVAREEAPAPAEMPAPIDDASLVQRALDGDRWAMEALYRRHVKRVTNAVTRIIGRESEADDVVQETFLTAFSRLERLRDPAAFRGWVAQIAVNEVRMRLRRRRWRRMVRWGRDDDEEHPLERLASDEASPEVRAELARIDRVLGGMKVELRMAWTLRYVEGWELTEVATALDCSLATAKRRIKAAKDQIDRHVKGAR